MLKMKTTTSKENGNVHNCKTGKGLHGGFSLVEVVLALGVMSFAMVAILGMIPLGLTTLRESMDASAKTAIMQTIQNDANSSDRTTLVSSIRYFDESGQSVSSNANNWYYRVKTALVPIRINDSSNTDPNSGVSLDGETLLIGIEARNAPVSDANWSPQSNGIQYDSLAISTVILIQ
jgi:uncharacterized protein (TIGR02598 family)